MTGKKKMTGNQIQALVEGYNSELLEGEVEMTFEEMVEIMEVEVVEVDEFTRLAAGLEV